MNGRDSCSTRLLILNDPNSPFWHLQGRSDFFLSLLTFEHFSERFTLAQRKVTEIFFVVFLLRGLMVKFVACLVRVRMNRNPFFFWFKHLWLPFILVLIEMYVVGRSVKLFPLSLCLQWGGHVCYSFFSELQRIPSLLLLRAILISCVGMGAVNSFTVTAFWTRQIFLC